MKGDEAAFQVRDAAAERNVRRRACDRACATVDLAGGEAASIGRVRFGVVAARAADDIYFAADDALCALDVACCKDRGGMP